MDIRWHDSPESLHEEMWGDVARQVGIDYSEIKGQPTSGIDDKGNEVEVSHDEEMKGIRTMRCWGFIDMPKKLIHAWASQDCSPETLIHMLAHEVGHATGTPLDDPMEEEMRAEEFGEAARLAYRLMATRGTRQAKATNGLPRKTTPLRNGRS